MRLNTIIEPSTRLAAKITTRELADMLRIVPQTIRASVCRNGHYLGLVPLRISGKLLWDSEAVDRILAGERLK